MLKAGPSILAMLCGMMVAASAASTHMTPGSSISNLSNAAVAAVVVGTVAVFLARARSAEEKAAGGVLGETVLVKTADYEIITSNRLQLQDKINKMRLGGSEQLVVVSDFDMTLTSFLMPDGCVPIAYQALAAPHACPWSLRAVLRSTFGHLRCVHLRRCRREALRVPLTSGCVLM